jgi:hypothetical protein
MMGQLELKSPPCLHALVSNRHPSYSFHSIQGVHLDELPSGHPVSSKEVPPSAVVLTDISCMVNDIAHGHELFFQASLSGFPVSLTVYLVIIRLGPGRSMSIVGEVYLLSLSTPF